MKPSICAITLLWLAAALGCSAEPPPIASTRAGDADAALESPLFPDAALGAPGACAGTCKLGLSAGMWDCVTDFDGIGAFGASTYLVSGDCHLTADGGNRVFSSRIGSRDCSCNAQTGRLGCLFLSRADMPSVQCVYRGPGTAPAPAN